MTLTARVHDECNGSDVFGSDICTCRPYLTHAIEECIRGAQEGGVGLVVYCRKEGRALGEVTKFLVYNARKRQVGGDSASNYFLRTECVAGVQDMRFQELMPDVLHWLGVRRIHRLVSMSNMKYDAIVGVGHRGRRARRDPRGAGAGRRARRDRREEGGRLLHARRRCPTPRRSPRRRAAACDGVGRSAARRPCSPLRPVAALLSLRHSCASAAATCARRGRRRATRAHFTLDRARLADAADVTAARHARALSRPARFPYHSRWRHFEAGGVDRKAGSTARWPARRAAEAARARIDLAVVSVLLDAGAGAAWRYVEPRHRRDASRAPKASASRASARSSTARSRRGATSRAASTPRRCSRSTPRALARDLPGGRRQSAGRPRRAASRCCSGSAARSPTRCASAVPRGPGVLFDLLTGDDASARGARGRASSSAAARRGSAPSGSPATRRTASRSATRGAIRMPAARARPRAGCRSTSSRSGSRIRCSSRSSGPASRVTDAATR